MSLSAFLQEVVQIMDDCGIPYMLTGSLAAAYYATPRATKDIDIVFASDESGAAQLVTRLQEAGLYVAREAALDALATEGQFMVRSAAGESKRWSRIAEADGTLGRPMGFGGRASS